MKEFDFDIWSRLAFEEPGTFESMRKQIIKHEISKASSSNQIRLSGLQFQIDMQRERSNNSLGACIKISGMMMDHYHEKFLPCLSNLKIKQTNKTENTNKQRGNVIYLFEP